MLKKVASYIAREIPLPPHCRLVVGLSGGSDSVALLHLLVQLGYDCVAAHCHFGLRGKEADRDRDFSRDMAQRLGVEFETVAFDTYGYAREHRCSIELACRELRYAWFEEIRVRLGAAAIAVAHHRDDSVETLFLNLLRGTGLAGVTGIRPQQGRVIRPLLCCTRAEIESYLATQKMDFVTDSTNLECCCTRNKIRLQLMPLLEQIRPGSTANIAQSMRRLVEAARVYRQSIAEQIARVTERTGDTLRIDIAQVEAFVSPSSLLFEILSPYGFSSAQCDEVTQSLRGASGKQYFSPTHRLVRDRSCFLLEPLKNGDALEEIYTITAEDTQLDFPIRLRMETLSAEAARPLLKTPGEAFFDAEKLSYPLTLRHWRKGDRFVPFGMRGSKKLSDYFSDHKYSLPEKELCWLLCSGDTILWIVGERSAAVAAVSADTRSVKRFFCE